MDNTEDNSKKTEVSETTLSSDQKAPAGSNSDIKEIPHKWYKSVAWWALLISFFSLSITLYDRIFPPKPSLTIESFTPVLIGNCDVNSHEHCRLSGVLELNNSSALSTSIRDMRISGILHQPYNKHNKNRLIVPVHIAINGVLAGSGMVSGFSKAFLKFDFIDFTKPPGLSYSNVDLSDYENFMKGRRQIKLAETYLPLNEICEIYGEQPLTLSNLFKNKQLIFQVLLNNEIKNIDFSNLTALININEEEWTDDLNLAWRIKTVKERKIVEEKLK